MKHQIKRKVTLYNYAYVVIIFKHDFFEKLMYISYQIF